MAPEAIKPESKNERLALALEALTDVLMRRIEGVRACLLLAENSPPRQALVFINTARRILDG